MRYWLILIFLFTATYSYAQFGSGSPLPSNLIIKKDDVVVEGGGRTVNFEKALAVTYDTLAGQWNVDTANKASDIPIIDTGSFFESGEVEGALQEIGRIILPSSCKALGYSFYNDADGETAYWCMNGVELASVKFTPTFDNRVVTNGDNRVTTSGDSRRVR